MSPFREGIFLKATLQLRSLTVKVPDQMSQVERATGLSGWSARTQPRLSSPSPGLPILSELQCLRGGSLLLPFLYDRSRNTKHKKSSVSLPICTLPRFSPSMPVEPVYMSIMTELSPRQALDARLRSENLKVIWGFSPLILSPSFYTISEASCKISDLNMP